MRETISLSEEAGISELKNKTQCHEKWPCPALLVRFSITLCMQETLSAHLHLCGSVMKVFCEGKRKKSLEELSLGASHYSSCQWLYLSELYK